MVVVCVLVVVRRLRFRRSSSVIVVHDFHGLLRNGKHCATVGGVHFSQAQASKARRVSLVWCNTKLARYVSTERSAKWDRSTALACRASTR